jgi:hypothetical protein
MYLDALYFFRPGPKRHLLRVHFSTADFASLLYASYLLNDANPEHPGLNAFITSVANVTRLHLHWILE